MISRKFFNQNKTFLIHGLALWICKNSIENLDSRTGREGEREMHQIAWL